MEKTKYTFIQPEDSVISVNHCIRLSKTLRKKIDSGCRYIVLDLKNANEIAGSFTGFIAETLRAVNLKGGDLLITNVNAHVSEILTLVGLGPNIHKVPEPHEYEDKNALVVAADPDDQKYTKRKLLEIGMNSLSYSSVKELCEAASLPGKNISVSILDIDSFENPEKSFEDLCALLPGVPVLITTSLLTDISLESKLRAMDSVILYKPFLTRDLKEGIELCDETSPVS
ncbi:MAG: STAS domain-containing protein [Fibrobacterota bacterium]